MIQRELLGEIMRQCNQGKVIVLIGARQVGKTTILKQVQKQLDLESLWLNADEADVLLLLENADTSTQLRQLIGTQTQLLIIDEAQQVKNIGKKLKLLHDTFPEVQVIVTGSSALDLQDATNEPLTGRKKSYNLYPIAYDELVKSANILEARRQLEARLIFGSYPEVINSIGREREVLIELVNSYLYKDILQLEGIRKPQHLEKLVRALAFQVGNEVSVNELARTIGNIDAGTVEKYLELLQKSFIIHPLTSYSRNLRNEIRKGRKYYFYDLGVRNAVINNFAPLDLRMDKGAIWENFLVMERMKQNHYQKRHVNAFFWRTKDRAEVDYIEEVDGVLNSFEFKWKPKKAKLPNSFAEAYPNHTFEVINIENFENFIIL